MRLNLKEAIASVKDKYSKLTENDEAQIEDVNTASTDSEVNDPVVDTAVDVAVQEGTFDALFESFSVNSSAAILLIREQSEGEGADEEGSEDGAKDIEGTEETGAIAESFILREADEEGDKKDDGSSEKEKGFFGKIWDKVVKAWNTLVAFVEKIFFRVKRFFLEKFGFYNRILKNEAAIKDGYTKLTDSDVLKAGSVIFSGYDDGIKFDPIKYFNEAKTTTNIDSFLKASNFSSIPEDKKSAFLDLKYTESLGRALKNTLPGGVDYTPAENNVTDGINAYIKFMEGEKTTQDTPITKLFKSSSEVIAILKAATEASANKINQSLANAVKEFKKSKEGIIKTFMEARKAKASVMDYRKLAVKADTVMRAICNTTMSLANAQVNIIRTRAYSAYQVAKLCAKKGGAKVEEEKKDDKKED